MKEMKKSHDGGVETYFKVQSLNKGWTQKLLEELQLVNKNFEEAMTALNMADKCNFVATADSVAALKQAVKVAKTQPVTAPFAARRSNRSPQVVSVLRQLTWSMPKCCRSKWP